MRFLTTALPNERGTVIPARGVPASGRRQQKATNNDPATRIPSR